ncbi:MAG: hypothetical protein KBS61_04990 [Chryseobacterium sp.]|nr:hypothetical protein [Candidatus Chryseobacterium enterohippi]
MFTEQAGTPIGVDITYYAGYEKKFYHLKAEFPVDKMKEMVRRAYAINETNSSDKPLKEFIYIDEEPNYYKEYNSTTMTYYRMTDLVFGFAPN